MRNKKVGAIVTSDKTTAFELVNHDILENKLKHIEIKCGSVNLIMDYLTDRSQYVEINTNVSNVIKTTIWESSKN